jgi:hypothetical protein
MQNKTRLKSFAGILLLSLVLFMATSQRANAWFFDPFENMVEQALQSIENITLGLSNDIMGMADNIGIMADRILIMADKIGEMSDRIVYTEELMLAALTDSGISSLITSPTEGSVVNRSVPINITLSSQKTDYLLYISNNADMSGATNALVQNADTSIAWARVADFATGNKLYIAVKTVGGTSSDFSNTVMLNLQ